MKDCNCGALAQDGKRCEKHTAKVPPPSERVVSLGPAMGFGPHDCIVVRDGDTKADLVAKGMKPEAADEVLRYGEYLKAKASGETRTFREWDTGHDR